MSNKNLDYYKGLVYTVIVEKQEMDGKCWFIAYTNELGKYACYGRGENQVESLNSFLEEKDGFIDYLFKEGKSIPEPNPDDYETGNLQSQNATAKRRTLPYAFTEQCK